MLEDVTTKCPKCEEPLTIRWEDSGLTFQCKQCSTALRIEEDSIYLGDGNVPILYVTDQPEV